jgi:hypothetical protein
VITSIFLFCACNQLGNQLTQTNGPKENSYEKTNSKIESNLESCKNYQNKSEISYQDHFSSVQDLSVKTNKKRRYFESL